MCGPIIRAVHQIAESLEAFAFPSAGFPEKGKGRNIKIAAMPIATSSVNADFARRNFDARSLPTIVLFDNGVQIGDIFTKGDLMDQNALALQVVENKGLRPALVSMIERWFCRQIETPAGTRKTIVRSPEGIILPFDPR